jgi:transcriptional regulator with XRE-family HTH domain
MQKAIHSPDQIRLRDLLKTSRIEAGLTQQQLARRLSVPQSFVSKYESGERRLDLIELRSICKAIGMSLQVFVKRFDESAK